MEIGLINYGVRGAHFKRFGREGVGVEVGSFQREEDIPRLQRARIGLHAGVLQEKLV